MIYKNITVDSKLFDKLEFLKDETLHKHGKRHFTWPATLRFLFETVWEGLDKKEQDKILEGV